MARDARRRPRRPASGAGPRRRPSPWASGLRRSPPPGPPPGGGLSSPPRRAWRGGAPPGRCRPGGGIFPPPAAGLAAADPAGEPVVDLEGGITRRTLEVDHPLVPRREPVLGRPNLLTSRAIPRARRATRSRR